MTETDDNFIPFIHNYCDRWCERCEFTLRCRVYDQESKSNLAASDDLIRDAVRTVAQSFAEAKQMLLEKAAELGIDLEAAANDPEITEGMERQRAAVEDTEAVEFAKNYAFETRPVLESADEWIADRDDPMTEEMLSILSWYMFFIAAKVHRGYHGIIDFDGEVETDELNEAQSDANGSIKIALIAIERSILAWTYLMTTENANLIRPQIEKLEKIRAIVEAKFPYARDFVRPGFDEIEMVM